MAPVGFQGRSGKIADISKEQRTLLSYSRFYLSQKSVEIFRNNV